MTASVTILGAATPATKPAKLPLFERVSCGFPSPAENHSEAPLSLDELVRLREPSSFLVRAEGDSMIGAGLYAQDVIIVDRAKEARHGDIVIVCIGAEFLVKRLDLQHPGGPRLLPENPRYQPIVLQDGEELLIWGVCTHNLHSLEGI